MTFRVIEGGGSSAPPYHLASDQTDRWTIINRVAGAIYESDDHLQDYMDWQEFRKTAPSKAVAKYITQAKLAIEALRPGNEPSPEDCEVAYKARTSTTPSAVIVGVQDFIDEVLR